MGESSSGKWYKSHTIIAAVITSCVALFGIFVTNKKTSIQSPPPPSVSTTTTVIVTSAPSLQGLPDPLRNDVTKTDAEQTAIKSDPSVRQEYSVAIPAQEEPTEDKEVELPGVFQDDFEEELKKWRAKRYPGYYNDSMRWHRSDKEYFSGQHSLSLGHEDTDRKENSDPVYIETKEELLLTENAVLSFKIKKEYRINLEIVLKKKDATFKETVIKFYPGNTMYKEWRAEEIPLGSDIVKGRYTLILRAWSQGSLYLDDIKIQK
ncbi:MAG: hypothetical protein D3925_04780 [Candidatus Electrothrix sp. AR5]|nr:hypothetical protein [Candidatus Electrothrix sp. AR5]